MKIGIGNYYIDKYGMEAGAEKMAAHGYDCIDFQLADIDNEYYSIRDEEFVRVMYEIKGTLKKKGITVHQIHGPWRFPPRDGTEDERAVWFARMTKAMVMAKHLGAEYMAVHPLMPYGANSPEDPMGVYELNKNYYTSLAKVAQALGVVICLENMPFTDFPLSSCESILKLIKDIGSKNLKMCFDVGHANVMGEPLGDTVRMIGDDLRIVHLHDNFAERDQHLPPYDGTADIPNFAEGLYDIGFDGVLVLECRPAEESEEAELALAKLAKLIAG